MKERTLRNLWRSSVMALIAAFVLGCPPEEMVEVEEFFFPRDMQAYEFDGEPELEGPDRLLFLGLEVGERGVRQGVLRNVGRTGLHLEGFRVEGPFTLEFPEYLDGPPSQLSPGQSLLLGVSYLAEDEEPREGLLTVESNDPKNEVHEIALLANVDLPCVIVEPSTRLRFGSVVRGESRERAIRLINCSETQPAVVEISDFEGDGGFALVEAADRAGEARVLAPGTSEVVAVEFGPEQIRPYEGSVIFRSEDGVQPEVMVELRGEGANPDCPVAVIRGTSMEGTAVAAPSGMLQGAPLEVVGFDGMLSQAFGGATIEEYEWSLVMRPADTVVELEANQGETNSLYLELAGVYEVELHVRDSEGTRSCDPARMVVESVSGDGLHIQLVWDTPNDPSRTNGSGADLDLHLRHETGIWNTSPMNCYWLNMNPNWGDPNDSEMNPSLDIDKIDGWGPENINLRKPEEGVNYSVGVYYFSDHGYGASYGTVRIYIDGQLELELKNRRMTNHQFWHVADVAWPTRLITIYDGITQGFPN